MARKQYIETLYDKAEAGTLTFQRREEVDPQIRYFLEIVTQLKHDLGEDRELMEGLEQIEVKLQALRISNAPLEQIQANIESLVNVPLSDGRLLRLDGFRKSSVKPKLSTPQEYIARVDKLIENTLGVVTQLLLVWPDDTILQTFMRSIQQAAAIQDYNQLKAAMEQLGQSPALWYYNDKKRTFLLDWLRPFADQLGADPESLSDAEMEQALKRVDLMREKKLAGSTNLEMVAQLDPFRRFNHQMHPVINGRNADFWGSIAVRDEFITLMSKIINHFSFNLDDRFLLFKTKDGQFVYLLGFADDAFQEAMVLKGSRLAIYPHLKVMLPSQDGKYHELTQHGYLGNLSDYYKALKNAVVPFLTSMSKMVEFPVSKELKESFDMWI